MILFIYILEVDDLFFSFYGWGGGGGGRSNWKDLEKGIKSTAETNLDIISDLISFRVASPVMVNCTDVVLESHLNRAGNS
jgi:hypothetical protein